MIYSLDTNTCIAYLNGRSPNVLKRLQSLNPDDVAICSIVRAELFFGAKKGQYAERTLAYQRLFLDQFLSLPFDNTCAEVYGEIRAALAKRGALIGPNDLLIASIALTHNLILVTHNTSEFSRVPDLHLENWEAEV